MKDLVIIGTGGVGRETALIVEAINRVEKQWNILGFVDDDANKIGKVINGYEVIGDRNFLGNYDKEIYTVCAIANYNVKKSIISMLKNNKNINFPTLIHPSVELNNSIKIGEGCIVYQNVIMTANINIGNYIIISPKCGIGHDSNVDDFVSLLWNVNVSGNVTIREGVTIGSGATVIQGITVDERSFIGAGSVVIRDIVKDKIAVGVPSKYIEGVKA